MRLSNEKYEEIKNTVIDTFEQYNVKCIPISGFEIATKMGLKIIPYSSLNEKQREMSMKYSSDGYSIETQNEWRIYYNDSCKCYGRINQTIMHEVGHFVLGHIDGGEEEESEAKFFAKYAFLDALEKRYAESVKRRADAISFGGYKKEVSDHV